MPEAVYPVFLANESTLCRLVVGRERSIPLADERLGLPINFNVPQVKDGIIWTVNGFRE